MALPPKPGPDRDNYILEAVKNDQLEHEWTTITTAIPGHTATFTVFAKPGKIDGIYVGVGARILQTIADLLGASLLTPKLQDTMWTQAKTKITPWLDYNPTNMQLTTWFQRSTTGIDAKLAAAGYVPGTLMMGQGKPWQLTNLLVAHPGKSINYGLYVRKTLAPGQNYLGVHAANTVTPTDAYVLQDPGWAHTLDQDDYSELISLLARPCIVDGVTRDVTDIMQDPELAALVSHEGPLKVLRQPGVPIVACRLPSAGLGGANGSAGFGASADGSDGTTVCKPPTSSSGAYGAPAQGAVTSGSAPGGGAASGLLVAGGIVAGAAAVAWGVNEWRQRTRRRYH